MARYSLQVMLRISTVVASASRANVGTIKIANVRIIDLNLIVMTSPVTSDRPDQSRFNVITKPAPPCPLVDLDQRRRTQLSVGIGSKSEVTALQREVCFGRRVKRNFARRVNLSYPVGSLPVTSTEQRMSSCLRMHDDGGAMPNGSQQPSLRANGSRECATDDRLREAIELLPCAQSWIASSRARSSQ